MTGFLVLAISLLIAFVLVKTKPKAAPIASPEKAWLVAVDRVERQALSPNVVLYGRIESLWYSSLTTAVTADVESVRVIEGNLVQKGDVLVILDQQDASLMLAQRQADLDEMDARIQAEMERQQTNLVTLPREKRLLGLTESEVKRAGDLLKRKLGSQSTLDAARISSERQAISLAAKQELVSSHSAKLMELQARQSRSAASRDLAQLDLSRTRILAPFNGRIARLLVSPGQRVRAGDALIKIYDTDAMVLRAQVPGRHLPELQAALASGEALVVNGVVDDQQISATLLSIAGEVETGTGGVEALFFIEGEGAVLRYGRFVRLDLELPAQADLIALPHEAIYGSDTVYRLDGDNRMRSLKIQRMGESRNEQGDSLVLIRSDQLNEGDVLVVTQLPNALDGLLVRVP